MRLNKKLFGNTLDSGKQIRILAKVDGNAADYGYIVKQKNYNGFIVNVNGVEGAVELINGTPTDIGQGSIRVFPYDNSAGNADVIAATVDTAGAGYMVGDILSIDGGTHTAVATFEVLEIDDSAGVNDITLTTGGALLAPLTASYATTASADGVDAVLYVDTWQAEGTVSVVVPGTEYVVGDLLTVDTGGTDIVLEVATIDETNAGVESLTSIPTDKGEVESPLPVGAIATTSDGTGLNATLLVQAWEAFSVTLGTVAGDANYEAGAATLVTGGTDIGVTITVNPPGGSGTIDSITLDVNNRGSYTAAQINALATLGAGNEIAITQDGDTTATAVVTHRARTVAISASGDTGHVVGDTLTTAIGVGATTEIAAEVSAINGPIDSVTVSNAGVYTFAQIDATNNTLVVPHVAGAGDDTATFTISHEATGLSVRAVGSGYVIGEVLTADAIVLGGTEFTATVSELNGGVSLVGVINSGAYTVKPATPNTIILTDSVLGSLAALDLVFGEDPTFARALKGKVVKAFDGNTYRYNITTGAIASGDATIDTL